MILRTLALASGLSGALALSQFPEFSQQYVQRLGGAVDALGQVVADFDASAQAEGLSRADALASMVGSDFVVRRRADMERTIARHDRLSAKVAVLMAAGPVMRAVRASQADPEIVARTWASFQPAVPATSGGVLFGGVGALFGWLLVAGAGRFFR